MFMSASAGRLSQIDIEVCGLWPVVLTESVKI